MRTAFRRARPQLILHSQMVPDVGASHYVTNAATWATCPFDGINIYSVVGSTRVFNRVAANLVAGDVSAEFSGFHAAAWGTMTKHWPMIRMQQNGVGEQIDYWNDAHWTKVCSNVGVFTAGVKGSKVAGLIFDNEHYHDTGPSAFDWVSGGGIDPTHTLAQSQVKVAQRGEEFMDAVIAQWPEARVTVLHGPYVSEPKTGADVWTNQTTDPPYWNQVASFNELQGWFTWGMGRATIGTHAKVYDGGEIYAARTVAHMRNVNNWRLDGLPNASGTITPSDIRGSAYPLGIAQGVYDADEFNGFVELSIAAIGATITAAMRMNPMVWFYNEYRDPYPGGLPGNEAEQAKPHYGTAYNNGLAAARAAGRL